MSSDDGVRRTLGALLAAIRSEPEYDQVRAQARLRDRTGPPWALCLAEWYAFLRNRLSQIEPISVRR
jgi:hypothetical protein